MKNKKLILVAVLAAAMVMLMACTLSQVTAIEFVNKPNSTYKLNESVDASQFKVKITMQDSQSLEIPLSDSRLTVQGLVDGKLDTSSVGTKTITVAYQGISITFDYEVTGAKVEVWEAAEETGDGKKTGAGLLYALNNPTDGKVTLSGTYDLDGKQWKSVDVSSNLTIEGTATIKNMTITDESAVSVKDNARSAAGFLGFVTGTVKISGITFENATINYVDLTKSVELNKNYGVVIGRAENATVTIEKVNVVNAYVRGVGRLGGIIGASYSSTDLTVTGCNVVGTFEGVNPVTEANADGEADKIGGIVGDVYYWGDNANNKVTITNNNVTVAVSGTRNLGGIAGRLAAKKGTTVTGNTVNANSVIAASVLGGVLPNKGRNVGGLIGVIDCRNTTVLNAGATITGNTVAEGVKIVTVSAYDDITSGTFVGGIYGNEATNYVVNSSLTDETGKATYNYKNAVAGTYDYDTIRTALKAFNDALKKANTAA